MAFVLLGNESRKIVLGLFLVAVAGWALPALFVEAALTRWHGFGPRSLAEAAGIAPAQNNTIGLFTRRLAAREDVFQEAKLSSNGVALSARNLLALRSFLQRTGFRNVFAQEAVAALRQGWRERWDAERALDSLSLRFPGVFSPDYSGALDLIKAGPLTRKRWERLRALDAVAKTSTEGFENLTASQLAFEGFAAAYARFGDESDARRWLARVDNLWPINEKQLEITPLQDFHQGRIAGSLLVDGLPGVDVHVGLFMVWTSTGPGGGRPSRLLCDSAYPDEDGRFIFESLGAGRYELALLAPAELLRGRAIDAPGILEIDENAPAVVLPPIRIERWPSGRRLSYNPSE